MEREEHRRKDGTSAPSMIERLPSIYFYIPQSEPHFADLPSTIEGYWPQLMGVRQLHAPPGRYNWTLQTYLYLRAGGVNCQLTGTLPREGIVVTHRDFLADAIRPGPRLLLVCLLADRGAPEMWLAGAGRHPYAQLHLVQNPQDALVARPSLLWESRYLPLWPQPGLIPRDAARGDRFEHAAYWHAGVPAVLGRESAYYSQRRGALDYVEVTSAEDALLALRRLRDDVGLRRAIVANGRMRAAELTPDRLVQLWRNFLYHHAIPAHERWCAAPRSARHLFFARRRLVNYRATAFRTIRRVRSWLKLRTRLRTLRPRSFSR